MRDRKKTQETNSRDAVRTDDERPASLMLVGKPGDERRTDHTKGVDWNCQELCIRGRVSQLFNDRRGRVGEAINGNGVALSENNQLMSAGKTIWNT